MHHLTFIHQTIAPVWLGVIGVLAVWELIWRSIALWKAAGHKQLTWFIVLAILNTAGILPIIYILFFQKKTIQTS